MLGELPHGRRACSSQAESAATVDRRAAIVVFCVAFAACAALTKHHVLSWNDGSRIATVDALTANHTFVIDGSPFAVGLGDKIRFGDKTYSDKPPLLALQGAVVALAVAPLGVTLRQTPGAAIYLVTLLSVGVWFAIGSCYAYAFQRELGFGPRVAGAVAALTGIGTLALPYAIVLTNHVPCGASVLAACFHLVRARQRGLAHVALGGIYFALAYAFDPAGIILALAGAVLLWGAPVRWWLTCAAAGAPIVALQLAYNLVVSGSVVPTAFNGAVWGTPPVPAAAPMIALFSPVQYAGFVMNLLFGGKGLFAFTPLVFVVAYGLVVMWRSRGLMRRVALGISAACAVFFALIVLLQNDSEARNFGERRFVDLFFLLGVALGPALTTVRTAAGVALVRLCVASSVALAALGTVAPFGGAAGESGFSFATAEFAALYRRAPIQAVIDVVVLLVVLALVQRLLPLRANGAAATAAARPRG